MKKRSRLAPFCPQEVSKMATTIPIEQLLLDKREEAVKHYEGDDDLSVATIKISNVQVCSVRLLRTCSHVACSAWFIFLLIETRFVSLLHRKSDHETQRQSKQTPFFSV